MNRIVERLGQVLAAQPEPALSASRVGARQPATGGDLPALVVSVQVDDVRGVGLGRAGRFNGVLTVEAWSITAAELAGVVGRALAKLRAPSEVLRRNGFLRLTPAGLAAAVPFRWEPASGAATVVYRQALEFRFAAEFEEDAEVTEGRIDRIDVTMSGPAGERLAVPSTPAGPELGDVR
ncbi:hypothetical protein ACTI_85620 [Actinoplanes sp. OR16]|uniref:hypothetical protein n=1 Tax=Actinoplanes sp. OR16 TaxID=946334 RepID=UPI000F6CFDAD|nr:hypothetical protein [Actinoplanes sp. OR16]BBH71877.1 hypothetical protein ACTI_85620 [Actinoplanes sp. OR16]